MSVATIISRTNTESYSLGCFGTEMDLQQSVNNVHHLVEHNGLGTLTQQNGAPRNLSETFWFGWFCDADQTILFFFLKRGPGR